MRAVRTTLLAVALVLVAASAWAQTEVAFFLTPKIGDGLTPMTAFRPKYTDPGALGAGNDLIGWAAMDYGMEAAFFVKADLTADQRAALAAQSDVLLVPTNIDNTVSALALNTIQTKLESVNLPAHWITTDMTYRQVIRGFRRVITLMQRYRGLWQERIFGGGVTLDTRLNQLTAQQRQRLSAAADSLGIDTSGVQNTMTLRQALRLLADQLPDIQLGGQAI